MFGDKPCPQCRRTLEICYEGASTELQVAQKLLRTYRCSACEAIWPSCPRCGGLVVAVILPLDLFRPPAARQVRCVDCRSFEAER